MGNKRDGLEAHVSKGRNLMDLKEEAGIESRVTVKGKYNFFFFFSYRKMSVVQEMLLGDRE